MAAPCAPGAELSHQGTVVRNDEVAPGCLRIEIACPAAARATAPGQFVMLRCREGMDPFLSRAFSVSDVVHEDGPDRPPTGIVVLVLVVGVGTRALSERRPGERIGLLGPLGKPYDLGVPTEHMLLVAGGIGAAPFAIVARALRERSAEQRVTYLVGGRDRDHVYLADTMRERGCDVAVATDDGSLGRKGYVTDLLAPLLAPGARVLACGPNPMFQALARVVAAARARGIAVPCEVSTEESMPCGFGACAGCVVPVAAPVTPDTPDGFRWVKSCAEGPVFPVEAIRWDLIRTTH